MGRLSYGVPHKHVMASRGADTNLMKFYSTETASKFGQRWAKFEPRPGRHTGTGYVANFRPGVYYSARLDALDNPSMGRLVSDNYHSVTEKSFQPSRGPDGTKVLPNNTVQVGSGFIREKGLNIPSQQQVNDACFFSRVASAPADVRPRHKPYLHKLNPKDPVELENAGYGPHCMSTETHKRYVTKPPDSFGVSWKPVGGMEGSGFTHAYNVEPVTFHPDYAHTGTVPNWLTSRPTGVSIQKTHFRPTEMPRGDEPLPRLAPRSVHDTGFTADTRDGIVISNRIMSNAYDKAGDIPPAQLANIRKGDPAEYINTIHPNNYSTISTHIYQGQQRPSKSESDRLGRTAIGTKELTGFCENNDRFVQNDDNPARFITHYMTKFLDRTPGGVDREGHTWGGIQPQKLDAYTKSTRVHDFAPETNSTATLRHLEPYVGRSLVARDPLFDDHKYDSKLHSAPIDAY